MFNSKVYIQRRKELKKKIGSGLILFLGNNEAPMNYTDNTYSFRQDSTFLYYFGIDRPELAALIDIDEDKETVYGNDISIDDVVWVGPQPTVKQRASKCGVKLTSPANDLETACLNAIKQGRKIHFLPQYRYDNILKIHKLLGIGSKHSNDYASTKLIKAIADQRMIKSKEEIAEIEKAIDISYEMQTAAMRFAKPGMLERDVMGFIAGLSMSLGSGLSFPIIFSRHGETLHNHSYGNKLKAGDLVVNDSGAETEMHYASDITRTFPVSGKFSPRQKDIYEIVLISQLTAIAETKPKIPFKSVHLKSAEVIAEGLKALGLMKGNIKNAVEAGAHALFFPHGLGHLMGLDVHDMENFGENNFGYDNKLKRSTQFGLKYLRYAKPLVPGVVLTVEPGIYFIPKLMDKWRSEKKFTEFINYDKVDAYRGFGGVRIEDDIVVTKNGSRVIGRPIPKAVEDVEEIASDKI
ncbi:MAG: Xaa-Pro aminopeptidase [Ignavibacteriae bacterium HGW-Ignavibacteriae-3]|nr:MAG: Xaa-Pro aminopeptidase [Ignavibacteriae bacterium HGW-Ignavibacteriae-3]